VKRLHEKKQKQLPLFPDTLCDRLFSIIRSWTITI